MTRQQILDEITHTEGQLTHAREHVQQLTGAVHAFKYMLTLVDQQAALDTRTAEAASAAPEAAQ